MNPRALIALATLATLGAAALFTVRLDEPRELLNLWTWLGTIAVAGLAFMLPPLLRGRFRQLDAVAEQYHIRLSLLVGAIGFGLLASLRYYFFLRIGGDAVGITVRLWFVAVALLIGALLPPTLAPVRGWLRVHRAELSILGTLTLIGGGLRFWQLGVRPRIINGDEGLIGTWALDIGQASGMLTMPFAAMDGVGTLYLTLMQQIFALLGPSAFSLRLLPAVAGTLAIPATYLFARRILNPRAALIAAALLTVSHVHIHFSRTVAVSYIYATLFVPLALYFLVSGLERRSPLRMALCVLMVGLHINFYVDGWVWLVLVPLLLAAWAVIDRTIYVGSRVPLIFFGVAAGIIITPMIIWALVFPDEFFARMAVDGTIASGWLAREAQLTGKPQLLLLAELLLTALGTFTHLPFIDFYGAGVPTLDPVSAALGVLGVAIALGRTWNRHIIVLNGWFWAGVVALGPTTVPPSTYHYRLLVALPAAIVLVALAIDVLLAQIKPLLARQPLPARRGAPGGDALIIAVALLVITTLNVQVYFKDFLGRCRYESTSTRQAGLLGNYLFQHPDPIDVYVLPTEHSFRAGPYLSLDFLNSREPITNIDQPLTHGRPSALEGPFEKGLVVAAVPERAPEIQQLQRWFPNGRATTIFDCGSEALYLFELRPTLQ